MSTTVQVIFLGLIGFIPSPEGKDDLAALLVNPHEVEGRHQESCPMERHIPFVVLLHGECEGECHKYPAIRKEELETLDLPALQKPEARQFPLLWLLDEEDLEISGYEDEEVKLRKPFLWFMDENVPKSERRTRYFSWVPGMDTLAAGKGQLREECRKAEPGCPLFARFRMQFGEAGACHFFHDLEPPYGVRLFDYTIQGGQPLQKAVPDAVLVTFEEKNDSVVLLSKGLPRRYKGSAWARLKPDSEGRLTLVVGNAPAEIRTDREAARACPAPPPHSNVFFDLLENPHVPRPTRTMNMAVSDSHPGSCEEEILYLARLMSRGAQRFKQYPHSVTACDGVSYPRPGQ